MSRIQERRPDGTYTRYTLAGSFGLGNHICQCGGMNPWKVGIEPEPVTCGHCGESLKGVAMKTTKPKPKVYDPPGTRS